VLALLPGGTVSLHADHLLQLARPKDASATAGTSVTAIALYSGNGGANQQPGEYFRTTVVAGIVKPIRTPLIFALMCQRLE